MNCRYRRTPSQAVCRCSTTTYEVQATTTELNESLQPPNTTTDRSTNHDVSPHVRQTTTTEIDRLAARTARSGRHSGHPHHAVRRAARLDGGSGTNGSRQPADADAIACCKTETRCSTGRHRLQKRTRTGPFTDHEAGRL